MRDTNIPIGGLLPVSFLDWENKVASVKEVLPDVPEVGGICRG
ncbi:hypothetical protein [Thermovirga lienii]